MALGIASLWRARGQFGGIPGLPLISRVGAPPSLSISKRTLQPATANYPRYASSESKQPPKDTSAAARPRHAAPESAVPNEGPSMLREALSLSDSFATTTRNQFLAKAFRESTPLIEQQVDGMRGNPFVTPAYEYPNAVVARQSQKRSRREARAQVGHKMMHGLLGRSIPKWDTVFEFLRKMTPPYNARTTMSAVRIVLPPEVDIDVGNQNLEFVDSTTGLIQRLRSAVDKNPSAVVLRGKSSVLAQAADEMVRAYPGTKVYQLEQVASSDYDTRKLWPIIEGATDGGTSIPDEKLENIWLHKEYEPRELTVRYEDISRPETWTRESFETYITALVRSKIPPHLAISLYGRPGYPGRLVDTEGFRIKLILDAFMEPAAQPYITGSVLNMALSLMSSKGSGHRYHAAQLLEFAEKSGVPMDVDTFNIILEGHTQESDVYYFFRTLREMSVRYIPPNVRTWLILLRFLKTENERRQVILAMYELGFFSYPAIQHSIADIMARQDAYNAFKAGMSLRDFLRDQDERYGQNWMSLNALNGIVSELLRFDNMQDKRRTEAMELVENFGKVDISTVNIFLHKATEYMRWTRADWALKLATTHGCQLNQFSYQMLAVLAIRKNNPHALGIIFFYGVLARKLWTTTRRAIQEVLVGCGPQSFWRKYPPYICPRPLIRPLLENKINGRGFVISQLEKIILDKYHGWTPVLPLERSLAMALNTCDGPLWRLHTAQKPNIKRGAIILRVKQLDGTEGKQLVRFNGAFDPRGMIQDWSEPEAPGPTDKGDGDGDSHPIEVDEAEDLAGMDAGADDDVYSLQETLEWAEQLEWEEQQVADEEGGETKETKHDQKQVSSKAAQGATEAQEKESMGNNLPNLAKKTARGDETNRPATTVPGSNESGDDS